MNELYGESVFAHRKETPEMQEKKRIKNIIMSVILSKNKLSNREAIIYQFYYYENLSHQEISKILGIAVKTSINHLYNANLKIRRIGKEIANSERERKIN